MGGLSDAALTRLERIVAPHNVCTEAHMVAPYAVDGRAPAALVLPEEDCDVAAVLRVAAEEKLGVVAVGHGSKLGMGMPPERYDLALGLFHQSRVRAYDPDDLTLSVEPGLPLARLETHLAEHNQFLPLAVPFTTQATVGGTIASGIDSPLRQGYGTARDFVLGIEYVTGLGEVAKSGGRVVKNVSGYDLHKLLIGSLGTLGVITCVNFRTFPRPAAARGFIASFSAAEPALALARRIARSPLNPLTLEVISPETAQVFAARAPRHLGEELDPPGPWFSRDAWTLACGFGGEMPLLERHARDLTAMAEEAGGSAGRVLGEAEQPLLWGRLREFVPLMLDEAPAATILKLGAPPSHVPRLVARLGQAAERCALRGAAMVRAAGVIWFALLAERADAETLARLAQVCAAAFEAAREAGGHASVAWCPAELKARVGVWGPPREDLLLMRKVKQTFDPQSILSPGRFVGGL